MRKDPLPQNVFCQKIAKTYLNGMLIPWLAYKFDYCQFCKKVDGIFNAPVSSAKWVF